MLVKYLKGINPKDLPVAYDENYIRTKYNGKELELSLALSRTKLAYDLAHEAYWAYHKKRTNKRPKCHGHFDNGSFEADKKCRKCWHWSSCWTSSPGFHYAVTRCDTAAETRAFKNRIRRHS